MTITLCGSLTFNQEMLQLQEDLEAMGHMVDIPESANHNQSKEWWADLEQNDRAEYVRFKQERIRGHFDKVVRDEAIVVANYPKKGIDGYIGANTLMEISLAFYKGKKIYFLFPNSQEFMTDEIEVFQPIILNGDLTKL